MFIAGKNIKIFLTELWIKLGAVAAGYKGVGEKEPPFQGKLFDSNLYWKSDNISTVSAKNTDKINLKIKNNFFSLTSRIHVEISFIKINNSGVKRDSVVPLLLSIIEVLVLTYISAKSRSETSSRKILFWKIEMVKCYGH